MIVLHNSKNRLRIVCVFAIKSTYLCNFNSHDPNEIFEQQKQHYENLLSFTKKKKKWYVLKWSVWFFFAKANMCVTNTHVHHRLYLIFTWPLTDTPEIQDMPECKCLFTFQAKQFSMKSYYVTLRIYVCTGLCVCVCSVQAIVWCKCEKSALTRMKCMFIQCTNNFYSYFKQNSRMKQLNYYNQFVLCERESETAKKIVHNASSIEERKYKYMVKWTN